MGFDLTEMLGVSREAVIGGALAGLALAVLMAVARVRRRRVEARVGLDLGER